MSHTLVVMEISEEAYNEIAQRFKEVGYDHVFLEGGALDMTGIALKPAPEG